MTSVFKFDPPLCVGKMVVRINGFFHVLCFKTNLLPFSHIDDFRPEQSLPNVNIRIYDNSYSHALLMITIFKDIKLPSEMVAIEDTTTIYVGA